jgi:hypothetical protein
MAFARLELDEALEDEVLVDELENEDDEDSEIIILC